MFTKRQQFTHVWVLTNFPKNGQPFIWFQNGWKYVCLGICMTICIKRPLVQENNSPAVAYMPMGPLQDGVRGFSPYFKVMSANFTLYLVLYLPLHFCFYFSPIHIQSKGNVSVWNRQNRQNRQKTAKNLDFLLLIRSYLRI